MAVAVAFLFRAAAAVAVLPSSASSFLPPATRRALTTATSTRMGAAMAKGVSYNADGSVKSCGFCDICADKPGAFGVAAGSMRIRFS